MGLIMEWYFVVLLGVLCSVGAFAGSLLAGLLLKQQVTNMVAIVLEGILNDEELMDDVFAKIVESIKKQFASSKAASKRSQTAFDRKLARGLLKQYPIAGFLAEQFDLTENIEKNPELIFYAASKMPFLFQTPGMPDGNQNMEQPTAEQGPNVGPMDGIQFEKGQMI